MRTSYKDNEEVVLLLKDMTGLVEPVSMEERERRVKNGEYVRSIIIKEYENPVEYTNIVMEALPEYLQNVADMVGSLAEQLYAVKGDKLVLVDIVRAGIPIGILVRRYIDKYYGVKVPHYGVSLVKGLDKQAMQYVIDKHGKEGIQFIDGWTGRGTVTNEIKNDVMKNLPGVDPSLAVLSDPINITKYAGSREDLYIPHSPLNAAVTGLVSITVLNPEYKGENDFHAAMYLEDLEKDDISQWYVDEVSKLFRKMEAKPLGINDNQDEGLLDKLCEKYNRERRLTNPGINEAARAILRRPLEKLIVNDLQDNDVKTILKLAEYKGVKVEEDKELKGYKAITVADDNYIR